MEKLTVKKVRAWLSTGGYGSAESPVISFLLEKLEKGRRAKKRVKQLENGIRELHAYMSEPVGKDDFHLNGFASRYDSLRDLYDEEEPNRIEAALTTMLSKKF